jgi:Tol biopolymer transport system component
MRRTTLTLTGMTFLGLAIVALPLPSFAQSDPLAGLWQLNLGPPQKSLTVYIQGEGQNRKLTAVGINAAGNALSQIWSEFVEDGRPHPIAGNQNVDSQTYTRADAHTINISRLKDGKTVGTAALVVSPDGKTMTFNNSTTQATGRQISETQVYDKQ